MKVGHSKYPKFNNKINSPSRTLLINDNHPTPSPTHTTAHPCITQIIMGTVIIKTVVVAIVEVVPRMGDGDTVTAATNVASSIIDFKNKTNVPIITGPMAAVVTSVPTAKHPWKVINVMLRTTTAITPITAITAIAAIDGVGA